MTVEEVAELLISQLDTPKFTSIFTEATPFFSLELVTFLARRARGKEFRRNAWDALRIVELADLVAGAIDLAEGKAYATFSKAPIYRSLNEYKVALACYQEALLYYESQQHWTAVIAIKINSMSVLFAQTRYQEMLSLEAEIKEMASKIGEINPVHLANLESWLAQAYDRLGDLQRAKVSYERVISAYKSLEQKYSLAATYLNYGILLRGMGQFASSESMFREAASFYEDEGLNQELTRTELNMGVLDYLRGQYQSGLEHLDKAREGFYALSLPVEIAVVDMYRSMLYSKLGFYVEAIELAQSSLGQLLKSGLNWQKTLVLINQGSNYVKLGLYDEADALFSRARRYLKRSQTLNTLWALDKDRAYLAYESGNIGRALRIAVRLSKRLDAEQSPREYVQIHALIARCKLNKGAGEGRVWQHVKRAQGIAEKLNLKEELILIKQLKAEIAEQAGDLSRAYRFIVESVELVELMKNRLLVDDLQMGFVEDKQRVYGASISLSHRLVGEAGLEVDALIHHLTLAHTAPLQQFSPTVDLDSIEDIDQEFAELREQWHWLSQQQDGLRDIHDGGGIEQRRTIAQTQQELNRIEGQLAELMRRRQIRQRRFADDTVIGGVWQKDLLQAVQASLDSTERFVHYYEADGACHIVLVSGEDVRVFADVTTSVNVARLLQAWQFHCQSIEDGQNVMQMRKAQQLCGRIFAWLIEPFAFELVDCTNLYVVFPPHWHGLPLIAAYSGSYIIEQVDFTFVSSARALLGTKGVKGKLGGEAVVLGYSDGGRLHYAVDEAEYVAERLSEDQKAVRLMIEEEATWERVRVLLPQCNLLHLATHSIFRPDNPLFSWFQLADSRVTVSDLYRVDFDLKPLIVLSSCESGRGKPRGGGMLGMARAFFVAGAGSLIVSAWPLDDAHTTALMKRLYEQDLSQNEGAREKLNEAQRHFAKQNVHPFFWAGYSFMFG